jgi:hypothetical protein
MDHQYLITGQIFGAVARSAILADAPNRSCCAASASLVVSIEKMTLGGYPCYTIACAGNRSFPPIERTATRIESGKARNFFHVSLVGRH